MTGEINKYKFDSTEDQKLYDIKAKLDIAKHVMRHICLAKEYNKHLNDNLLLKEASRYFTHEILTNLLPKDYTVEGKPKTYSNWNEQICMQNFDDLEICNTDKFLRDIIVEYYLVKKSLPIKTDILNKIMNTNKSWKTSDIEICMKARGYKSKRLPGCTKSIIVEDPEHSWARIKYLQSIGHFRKAGAHVIYIEKKIVNENETLKRINKDVTLFYVAVSSSMGMISNKELRISKRLVSTYEYDKYSLLMKWILEIVLPQVSVPSILVLEDKLRNSSTYADTPTMYSSRNVMINWLEINDIPHNSDMHSAELFEIIKRSNRNYFKRNLLDETLISYGHKALRRPPKTQYLNYFNIHWENVKNRPNKLKMDLFNQTSINKWKELETELGEIEIKTLRDDIAVINTIEKIFTFAKHKRIPYDYIEKCDDGFDEFKMEETVHVINS